MSGRKTRVLSYSLKDRGRKYNGPSRDNVSIPAMVQLINSPAVQELVNTSSMHGFYGHQIRQRFGMIPPETVIIDGRTVQLEPAFTTVKLSASPDGVVSHQAEFCQNNAGEFAMKQYQAKVGGFSTAVNYKPAGIQVIPTGFFGFDYVLAPNFVSNAGDGQLFDGLYVPEQNDGSFAAFDSATDFSQLSTDKLIIASLLEQQIISTFDSINSQLSLAGAASQAYDQLAVAMAETQQLIDKQERKRELQAKAQQDLYTGIVHPISSFDSAVAAANELLQQSNNDIKKETQKEMKVLGVNLPWWSL